MVTTRFSTIRPLLRVVVVVSFTTVPSGCVVVVVLVVDVVVFVVTGEGGATLGIGGGEVEQPGTRQNAMIIKPKLRSLRIPMILS